MKVKTLITGLFILTTAVLFGLQVWNGIIAVAPSIKESSWATFKIPIFNVEFLTIVKSLTISILSIIGGTLTREGLFGGD